MRPGLLLVLTGHQCLAHVQAGEGASVRKPDVNKHLMEAGEAVQMREDTLVLS